MKVRRLVLLCMVWTAGWSSSLADDATAPLKIVTYNIRYANPDDGLDVWSNRALSVTRVIAQTDLAGLQEVTYTQLADLRDRLPQFDWYGVGRDDGKHAGEHAVIFYRRDRFEPIDRGTFWLSESPEAVGIKGWDAALPRTCTWMVLRDKRSDQQIWVANTHFDHRGANARIQSGKLILRVVLEKAGTLPVIVMGDFNCLPGSEPHRALSRDDLLVDARAASITPPLGPSSTWNGFHEIVPDRIIDHIFVRGPLEIVSLETLNPKTPSGRFASDHLPVQVAARWESPKTTRGQ